MRITVAIFGMCFSKYDFTEKSMLKHKKNKEGTGEAATNSGLRKKALWTIVFVLIAVLTVWAITSQTKNFSFSSFWIFLSDLHIGWTIAAFVAMLLYIFFEGQALLALCKGLGYRRSIGCGYTYSAADIYFSAITPSATGGQPASAFLMMKDGIPGSTVAVALLLNLIMYTFSIIILGLAAFLIAPSMFLNFSFASKVLIIVGIVVQAGLATFFIVLLKKASILRFIGNKALSLLARIRLVRRVEKKKERFNASIDSYEKRVQAIGKQRGMLVKALVYNVLQRGMLIAVTVFAFLAAGGASDLAFDVWSAECMVVLGSNYVPIPGAMGVADGLMLDIFGKLFENGVVATNLELLSRAISFYLCVILCGISFLIRCTQLSLRAKKQQKRESSDTKDLSTTTTEEQ